MERLSIGDVAQRVGMKPSALRYYEEIGLLSEPERVSGRRVYSADIFIQLSGIQLAKQAGFTLEEIKLLLHGGKDELVEGVMGNYASGWQALAVGKLQELDTLIASAEQMKRRLEDGLACRCQTLPDCDLIAEKLSELLTIQ